MSSSDDDVRSSSDVADDDCVAYVRDDVAREYRRAFPPEQMNE